MLRSDHGSTRTIKLNGAAVQRYRKQSGLTQETLARRCSMTPESISRIENNKSKGTYIANAHAIARELGQPLSKIAHVPVPQLQQKKEKIAITLRDPSQVAAVLETIQKSLANCGQVTIVASNNTSPNIKEMAVALAASAVAGGIIFIVIPAGFVAATIAPCLLPLLLLVAILAGIVNAIWQSPPRLQPNTQFWIELHGDIRARLIYDFCEGQLPDSVTSIAATNDDDFTDLATSALLLTSRNHYASDDIVFIGPLVQPNTDADPNSTVEAATNIPSHCDVVTESVGGMLQLRRRRET